ncbi:MAG: hypothetical protein ABI563_08900 [Specibacter sp.]
MKSTRTLKAAGLVLIAVVLGLLTVQGSYALWNKAATSDAGTIQAADFRIGLTDAISARATNMTLEDGTAATLSLSTTPAGVVLPGQSTYAGVQVGNVTNASGDFTVQASTGAPIISNNNAALPLAPHLSIKMASATTLQGCNSPALFAAATPSTPASLEIAKDGTGVFCFQITLAATMPASLSGQSAAVSIPITVNQV